MKENWILAWGKLDKKRLFKDLEEATEKILRCRNICTKEEKTLFFDMDYDKKRFNPFLLSQMDLAVKRILEAKKNNEKVCIFGDFDADGVTSTALLSSFFKEIGINFFCYIPNKKKEGYSINKKALKKLKEQGISLIVTVDCGIASVDEIDYAYQLGMDVIVTDHHEAPQNLPDKAVAIINPKKKGEIYPEKELAGVGVAFKLVQAISTKIKNYNSENLKWYLDLVAIGTVADCVPLQGENRLLVKFGLMVLSRTKRVGLKQLFYVGGIGVNENTLANSTHISFNIAPRINAAGRIDSAQIALDLLRTEESQEPLARELALKIEERNKLRQKITDSIVVQIEKNLQNATKIKQSIVEYSSNWDYGMIGLAAGKIASKYNRPTFLFIEEKNLLKGSGRSVEGLNIFDILDKNRELFLKFGGHSAAVGLTIEKTNFLQFKKLLNQSLAQFDFGGLKSPLLIESNLAISRINNKLFRELESMEPFGKQNEKPVFLTKNLLVLKKTFLGKDNSHIKLELTQATEKDKKIEALGFRMAKELDQVNEGDSIDLVYHLEKNNWNGSIKPQALIIDFLKR